MDPSDASAYPESPLEEEEVFTCKGCGEILEQGRAFELAGHRWHLGCFRCHSCGTLLDSDANLLLLGDGSLICNNCTYSCSSCGNKIEDLAILTGDQAFCGPCFKCRNCKRKIENLRYARTSQGIFCMSCHESLMARRRKKAKSSRQATAGSASGSASGSVGGGGIVLDKSLPALPPSAVSQGALRSVETPPSDYVDTPPGARSPGSTHLRTMTDDHISQRDVSPMSASEENRLGNGKPRDLHYESLLADQSPDTATLTLPASTYRQERASTMSSVTASETDDDNGFGSLPMAFDPNPAPPPRAKGRPATSGEMERTPRLKENASPRDYFNKPASSRDRLLAERPASARSVSTERDSHSISKGHSPHVVNQAKERQSRKREVSGQSTPVSGSQLASPMSSVQDKQERPPLQQLNSAAYNPNAPEPFKLQEVPHDRKAAAKSQAKSEDRSPPTLDVLNPTRYQPPDPNPPLSPNSVDSPSSGFNPFDDPKLREAGGSGSVRHPAREDSLPPSSRNPGSKLASPDTTPSLAQFSPRPDHRGSPASSQHVDASPHPSIDTARPTPQSTGSPFKRDVEIPIAPPRSASRPTAPSKSVANDDFIAPRAPPPPPASDRNRGESVSTAVSEAMSPPPSWRGHLPKHSAGGDLSMEEEMQRILRGEENKRNNEAGASVLRRVSNAVKHGRSFSDRSVGMHQKTPTIGSMDISSPISSPSMRDDIAALKSQLRRAQQKITELETDKLALQEAVNTTAEMKQVNDELHSKRNTVVYLDAQREVVIRQLEVMTNHLKTAKDSNEPIDIASFRSEVLREFGLSVQKLKESLSEDIENLLHQRNKLTEEISSLIMVKDKGMQEYEALQLKNQQLVELNNKLVMDIQDTYRANRKPNHSDGRSPMMNGLGIYNANSKADLSVSDVHGMASGGLPESSSYNNLLSEAVEAEPATVLTAPQVVNIRKGQPRKFNWKKGSSGLAKNVSKGLKGAFSGGNDRMPMNQELNGIPYSQMQAGAGAPIMGDMPYNMRQDAAAKGGFGFFSSGQKNGLKPGSAGGHIKSGSSTNLSAESASVLFGSDLNERCEYEKRVIPAIVTRCVEEVESRGMDMEGIYRKSGGAGQVKQIQQGFDKDNNFDLSDPDLDIHAVTSALKQYFRRLPNPLITYEVYDDLLAAATTEEPEKRGLALREALSELPQNHRDVLDYLLRHLRRVIKMERENLMTPLNLSVVFAPTIMRPLSIEREMTDMPIQRQAVQALLDHADIIFDASE